MHFDRSTRATNGSISTKSRARSGGRLGCSRGRGRCALAHILRPLHRAGEQDAGDGALDRPELRVDLEQEAVIAHGRLGQCDHVGDVAWLHPHTKDDEVCRHLHLLAEGQRVSDLDHERIVVAGRRRFDARPGRVVEPEEHDALLRGLDVVGLLVLLVGPDVAIEVHDRGRGEAPADLVRRLERRRAADTRAVRVEPSVWTRLVDTFDLPAADAMDEDDGARGSTVHQQSPR